jgi:prevent-host-death family protein
MTDRMSLRDFRNNISSVLREVEAGRRLEITVDRRPVAEVRPLPRKRTWIPGHELAAMLEGNQADPGLREELREMFPDTTDDLADRLDRMYRNASRDR